MNRIDITLHGFPEDLPAKFGPDDWVALDLEIFGMDSKKLHRANTGTFACATLTADGKNVYLLPYDHTWLQHICDMVSDCNLIMQNGDFDIRNIRRWAKFPQQPKWFDTMYIEKTLYSGYYDTFSLKDMARRYLSVLMEKETRSEFETKDTLTDEMKYYAALDAAATWHIAMEQRKIITQAELDLWYNIDQPCIYAVMDMVGVKMDKEKWMEVANRNQETVDEEIKKFPFNPRSPKQVIQYFADKEMIKLKSSDADTLEKLDNPMAKRIVEFRQVAKLASTYGISWLEDSIEPDGRVYSHINVIGAETGRMSSDHPNIQNIPVRHNPIFRECFVADEGNILVIGDYSAQEPRCLAFESKDEALMKIFQDGKDIYCETGRTVWDEEILKGDPRRGIMKIVVLGLSYGMSVKGVARDANISEVEAEEVVNKFLTTYNGFARWCIKQQKAKNYVTNALGRKIWLNRHNTQYVRNALNGPIQSDASEITKLAVILLHKRWPKNIPFGLVLIVHDEIVVEVPAKFAEKAQKFLEKCMIDAEEMVIPGIPPKVEIYCGKDWSAKH